MFISLQPKYKRHVYTIEIIDIMSINYFFGLYTSSSGRGL